VVPVREGGGEQEFGPAEVHLVPIGRLYLFRIFLDGPDERPSALPLAAVDVELSVLEESDFSSEDRWDVGVVMVVVVMRDGEDVRVLARGPDGLPQLLLPRLLRRMRSEERRVGKECRS